MIKQVLSYFGPVTHLTELAIEMSNPKSKQIKSQNISSEKMTNKYQFYCQLTRQSLRLVFNVVWIMLVLMRWESWMNYIWVKNRAKNGRQCWNSWESSQSCKNFVNGIQRQTFFSMYKLSAIKLSEFLRWIWCSIYSSYIVCFVHNLENNPLFGARLQISNCRTIFKQKYSKNMVNWQK